MIRIPSLQPTSRPAQPATTFADSFVTQTIISAWPGEAWRAEFITQNYDYASGQIDLDSTPQSFAVHDLLAEAQRSTLVAQAMGAFLNAASLLIAERKALEVVAAAKTDDERAAAQAELTAIRTQLGVNA